jgi:nucleoside-diphosphate-sugar epimerase
MPVLVTGGAGFMGSHVVETLASAGHEVRVLDALHGVSAVLLAAMGRAGVSRLVLASSMAVYGDGRCRS